MKLKKMTNKVLIAGRSVSAYRWLEENSEKYEIVGFIIIDECEENESAIQWLRNNLHYNEFKEIADFKFEDLERVDYDHIIVIANTAKYKIYRFLQKQGISISKIQFAGYLYEILHFVTYKCSLKCRDCALMTPYFSVKDKDIPLETIKNEASRFMQAITGVHRYIIVGGEPFLYKRLDKYIEFLGTFKNIDQIRIHTNGTIVPKDSVIQAMQRNSVSVIISHYPELVDPKKLIDVLVEHGIEHWNKDIFTNSEQWLKITDIEQKKNSNDSHVKIQFEQCFFKTGCHSLRNGVVTKCCMSKAIEELQNIRTRKDIDYIDILGENLTQEKLYRYLSSSYPMEVCKYCQGTSGPKIPTAVQLKRLKNL